jgi:hypothetical protein
VTVTSRVPQLIDYLVTLFANAATLGQATPPVAVYDGPVTTNAPAQLVLWVGLSDPDNDGAQPAADFTQEWAAIGRQARNEETTVHCCAEAWSGVDDLATVRVAVYGITAAVEALMQADSTQFGGSVLYPAPGYSSGTLLQNNTQQGAVARVPFDLTFKSRIGG